MTDDELELVAYKVARILGRSTLIPASVQEWVRTNVTHSRSQVNLVYLNRTEAIVERWIINADGSLDLELADTSNETFWRGTFRAPDPIKQGKEE